ncbi:MAG: hypothetical protein ACR2RV_09865 [Verrucomicrobiales bacterium]
MAIEIPDYIIQHYQDPQREVALQRYFYIHGDPRDRASHRLLMMLAPLQIGDFVHLKSDDDAVPERRRVERIEHHEMDLRGLGESEYIAFVLFSPAGAQ